MKQNDIIKIFVTSRKRQSKDGKRKWLQYRTPMMLVVKGEEEHGKVKKWVNLTFCGKDLKTDNITRGYLHVRVSDINYPKVYEITKDEETGKDIYPETKIFGYESFTEVLPELDNPFIVEESETEETEIPSDEPLPFETEE